MKKITLLIFIVSFHFSYSQINGDFEIWDTTYTGQYNTELTTNFAVPNPLSGNADKWISKSQYGYGVTRTTDSYLNNYSLIVHNWYTYIQEAITYHNSINYKPVYLQGYYKYILGMGNAVPTGSAKIILTKSDGTSIDTIASGTYLFDSTSIYHPFQISLNYISANTPDSIKIIIKNAEFGQVCAIGNVCNLLYIDDIKLSNIPLSVSNNLKTTNHIEIYPNPITNAQSLFIKTTESIENGTIQIINTFGQIVMEKKINALSGNATIPLSNINLPTGIYYINLETKENKIVEKLIITK